MEQQRLRVSRLKELVGSDVNVFKELYKVRGGLDIRNLFDGEKFSEQYAYKDLEMENKLEKINSEQTQMQRLGMLGATPFFYFALKKMNAKWSAPGFLLIGGTKYYSIKAFYSQMEEDGVNSYWVKSKKFNGDLNKVEKYVEAMNK